MGNNEEKNKENVEIALKPEITNVRLSIKEVIKQIEEGIVKPESLNKNIKMKCAMFLKSRGYSSEEIGELLNADTRTVQRYLRELRMQNNIKFDYDFQTNIMSEVINNWRALCQRLLRLSYSEDMTNYEQARTVFMHQQALMAGVAIFERLGYLSQSRGEIDISSSYAKERNVKIKKAIKKHAGDPLVKLAEVLEDDQQRKVHDFITDNDITKQKNRDKLKKIIDDCMAENKEKERVAKLPPGWIDTYKNY